MKWIFLSVSPGAYSLQKRRFLSLNLGYRASIGYSFPGGVLEKITNSNTTCLERVELKVLLEGRKVDEQKFLFFFLSFIQTYQQQQHQQKVTQDINNTSINSPSIILITKHTDCITLFAATLPQLFSAFATTLVTTALTTRRFITVINNAIKTTIIKPNKT